MSYLITKFCRWHVAWMKTDGFTEKNIEQNMTPDILRALEQERSWTIVHNGEPIACGGVSEAWPGRGNAWMLVSNTAGAHMLFITRAARTHLRQIEGRIEMTVRADFENGHRWARMLGFEVENPPGILKAFGPDGADHVSYVMIN